MEMQSHLQQILRVKLAHLQAKNSAYSLRAYAKSLDIGAASLSEFLNGKRQFSKNMSLKIIEKLNLSPMDKEKLINNVEKESLSNEKLERLKLDEDNYFIMSDPLYYSILCLIETNDFEEDFAWMAKRLNVKNVKTVKEAVERLNRLGYISIDIDGKMTVKIPHLMTSDDVAKASLRKRHAQNLEDAKDALNNLPVEERYFRFETLAINKNDIPAIKEKIQKFFDELVRTTDNINKEEVVEFCFHYFPRTNKDENYDQSILQ